MEKKHAAEVGALHYKYIKSILRDLGKPMCIAFYGTALESEKNFGFVYVENSRVLGFIFGTEDSSQLFKHPRILYEMTISILKRPSAIIKIMSRQFKNLKPGPEGSFIAVEKERRREGLANQLMVPLLEEFKRRNYNNFRGWVEERNKASLSMALNVGSKIVGEFWEGRTRRFILDCPVEEMLKALKTAK